MSNHNPIPYLPLLAASLLLATQSGCALWNRDAEPAYRTVASDPNRDTEKARKENERALKLLEKGELDKARQSLESALAADVTFGPAHNNLGQVYFTQGNYYLAAWEFEYATRLMPHRTEPFHNLGLVYEEVGKFDEAVQTYEAALQIEPANPAVLGNLIRARLRRGDPPEQLRPLLADLVFLDTRPQWRNWARERLALERTYDTTASLERLPSPPPIRDPAGSPFRLESPDPQVPAPGHSFIQDPLPPALPAPPSLQPAPME